MTNVPLASIHDEWSEFVDFKNDNQVINNEHQTFKNKTNRNQLNSAIVIDQQTDKLADNQTAKNSILSIVNKQSIDDQNLMNEEDEELSAFEQANEQCSEDKKLKAESLEELVNTFDEKIVNCFVDYKEPVESIVGPVAILSHDELISDDKMWFKLSENFNHILPVSWQSTYAMKYLLPYLIGQRNENSSETNSDKNRSISNHLDMRLDCNFDSSLETQSDDQFVLSSFGYDYSSCKLQATFDNSFTNRKNHHFSSYLNEFENEYEEQLARDLDFHSLILCSNGTNESNNEDKQLLFTAEEVLKELDIILAEDDHYLDSTIESVIDSSAQLDNNFSTNYLNDTDELDIEISKESMLNNTIYNNNKYFKPNLLRPYHHPNSIGTSFSSNSLDDVLSSGQSLSRSQTSSSGICGIDGGGCYSSYTAAKSQSEIENEKQLFEKQLRTLNITQLNEIYLDLERMIQNHSEILISELALKDELDYEKELKNQFISLLICIQNKRRKQNLQKKSNPKSPNATSSNALNDQGAKYLTTVIPYNSALGPPDARTLQILIKILKAINEDSPTVPTLLTDFILKVICPAS